MAEFFTGGYFMRCLALLSAVVLAVPCADAAMTRPPRVVIEYEYQDARDFSEGLAAVRSDDKWGYIDRMGHVVIPFKFDMPDVGRFSEGMAFAGNIYIDKEGRPAFDDVKFEDGLPFSEGLAAVQLGGRWGFIDTAGKFVIPPAYEAAKPFSEGLAPVRLRGLWGYVDSAGRMKIPAQYLRAEPFSEGLAAVVAMPLPRAADAQAPSPAPADGLWCFIDAGGRELIRSSFDETGSFKYGLAPARNGNGYRGWGFIDRQGRAAIPHRYNDALPFTEGCAAVATDSRWGFVNVNGMTLIDNFYDEARQFSEGLAAVRIEDKWGYIKNN